MIVEKNDKIVARSIHGAYFLIDIADNYSGNRCALYELNQIGFFIWNTIRNNSIEEIATALWNEIIDKVDYEIIYQDVAEYIQLLQQNGFVKVVG